MVKCCCFFILTSRPYICFLQQMTYRQVTSFIIIFCVCLSHLAAQDSSNQLSMPIFTSGSLFYDFPQSFGAAANIEFPISSRHIFIHKKKRQKQRFREGITATEIGFYRYPFNNTGLLLQQSVGFRYHKTKPHFFEWRLTLGALRTFYDGTVYSVSETGVVNTLPHFGRWYAITGISTVFGEDLERSAKPKPLAISVRPSLWIQYPYNSFILPHLSLQLSLQYHFSSFNVTVRQKDIKRGHQL